jgi:hypothetical protein
MGSGTEGQPYPHPTGRIGGSYEETKESALACNGE